MHVEVNETNIDKYGLVQLTDNPRTELLSRAAEAAENGFVLTVDIPDGQVIEQNVFDSAEKIDFEPTLDICIYTVVADRDGGHKALCVVHNQVSPYTVEEVHERSGLRCGAVEAE